ncbi:hypothetical protein [Mucilaginibacter polytrichastri]|uniref:Uncharacterized protein n=1 Tax=Mucilaginibacter polytrichastri TaxID=1302689 RepID=A0A1Q6A3Q5_9SPHI|nr:hypothetical protein [Mucilaginibacter polytrichastri]OKS88641.1 hypothetical protein RG47T_4113 [Mucilaginibacter polytrichastri]SFT26415.1 hypothetical protein SAMN04487890_12522 [Mucilaginibacter polytrichastri]
MFDKAMFDAKVKTWLSEQIKKSVVKEVTECYDLMDKDNANKWNVFRICKKQLNAVRSKIVLSYVKVLELVVLIYK